MNEEHVHNKNCSRCKRKLTLKEVVKRIGRILCAICLFCTVGTVELGFSEVANANSPISTPSSDHIQFIFSGTSSTTAVSGDFMIDFANIQKVELPQRFLIIKEKQNPL